MELIDSRIVILPDGNTDNMTEASANRLVEFLEDQAGEYLRGAIHYSGEEYVSLYMREDVDALYSSGALEALVEYYREGNRTKAADAPFDLGSNHCTVNFFDDAILFHFTHGEDVGTVVTLEPEAGRDIVRFITDCLKQLHYNSPQDIQETPTWLDE